MPPFVIRAVAPSTSMRGRSSGCGSSAQSASATGAMMRERTRRLSGPHGSTTRVSPSPRQTRRVPSVVKCWSSSIMRARPRCRGASCRVVSSCPGAAPGAPAQSFTAPAVTPAATALRDDQQDGGGDGRDDGGRHDPVPVRRRGSDVAVQPERERHDAVARGEGVRVEEVRPGEQEREQRGRDDGVAAERHDDRDERAPARGAVDAGGPSSSSGIPSMNARSTITANGTDAVASARISPGYVLSSPSAS